LISQNGEISPVADMCIHVRVSGAVGLIAANDSVVGDDGAGLAKESAVPINDKEVAATSTKNISASTKPSQLVRIILIC
jgi:hypothetical protein